MNEQLDRLVIDILDLDGDSVPDNLSPETAEYWDSLNHLRLVTAIEQEFDIKLAMDDIQSIESITTLREIVKKYVKSE